MNSLNGHSPADQRVILLAPTARDGRASEELLAAEGIACVVCAEIEDVCREIEVGAAALLIPEEEIASDQRELLATAMNKQPVWSDLPIIVLVRSGEDSMALDRALRVLGNVTVVERPVRISTLLSLVRSAVRARLRQYQVRDHLAERDRAAEALRVAREQAEAANRSKDQFLAVLSHELRTPLSPVLMTISAMAQDPQLPGHVREDLEMVRRNVELEARLIDDLLDISRVTSGKLQLRKENISLNDLLTQVVEVCAADIGAKNLHVEFKERAKDDLVYGDVARLQQVFWNVLKNAVKFARPGQAIKVSTRNSGERNCVQVRVQDFGIGIPADVLPRLFNAFEQGSPAVTRQFGGLGLGLAISKALVDLHDGTIRAESDGPGCGTTLTVELKCQSRVRVNIATLPEVKGKGIKSRPRLLLVEDHIDSAKTLTRLLQLKGYEVRAATNVADALELVEQEVFDLIISDIGLPDATGYDLMRQIRLHSGTAGIALSGFGMEEDIRRSREAGFSDHIVKPVNFEELEATIQRACAGG